MFRNSFLGFTIAAAVALPAAAGVPVVDTSRSPHVRIRGVNIDEVRWTGGFWARWYDVNRTAAIDTVWQGLQNPANGAQYTSFLKATGQSAPRLDAKVLNKWSDGDVYKYVEALAALYTTTRDPALDRRMDEMIAVFARAQEPDGYLSTPIGLKGLKRWTNLNNHELYNMGHLMTAASIHYRATGKKSFLDIATRLADYLYTVFQPRPRELAHFCFNPSNIMGSLELYRTTRNPKYLELAGIFVDMRGSAPGGTDENQSHVPLRKENEAVGHAVTANYLYAGAADVYAETGEQALLDALQRIWTDMSTKRVYVTGAVGNMYHGSGRFREPIHEAFGNAYELPQRLGYNETCSNIASAMWNWRMFALTMDAKYAEIMERVLYNSMISGVNVDGKGFYYNNPLRRDADELPLIMRPRDPYLRSPTLVCYCCPTNVVRTLAELQGWAYGKSDDALWVNLYGSSTLETPLAGGVVKLAQQTEYPWDGVIRLKLEKAPAREISIRMRVPSWAEGAELRINNGAPRRVSAGAYADARRKWASGDSVELRLPMAPRLVVANPYVENSRNHVAVMRGPIVYALESPDLPAGVKIWDVVLPVDIRLQPRHDAALLGGVTVLEGRAKVSSDGDFAGALYKTLLPPTARSADIRLIPYYAWANRGISHMTVWVPVAR